MSGWIKLHRTLIDWEWYTDHNTCRLFIHCLLRANHSNTKWRGQELKRGQFLTSLESLSNETGLSISQIRTGLKKLNSTDEIASLSQARSRIITVLKYDKYQSDDRLPDKLVAGSSQADDRLVTTDKNVNNVKNDNNVNNMHALTDDWKPDKTIWEGKAFQAGLLNTDYHSFLTEFICHYQNQRAQTEVYWIGKLISWIKRAPKSNQPIQPQKLAPLTAEEHEEINNAIANRQR